MNESIKGLNGDPVTPPNIVVYAISPKRLTILSLSEL